MSVVIPAHDEASLIARTLGALVASDPREELELVVVANGCRDATAAVAAAVSPRVRVVEIAAASKIAALNAGDDAAATFPRAYVDADVDVTAEALLAVADRLGGADGVHVGAPTLQVDAEGASLAVRQYYRVWEHSAYRTAGHLGSGVYVLSAAGRARFGRFPEVIADDRYVQQLFRPEERLAESGQVFTVAAPRTFAALLDRATRIATGNRQIAERYPALAAEPAQSRFSTLLKRVAVRPGLWPAFGPYCVGYLVPRLRARRLRRSGRSMGWNRDETTRVAA